jgi:ankyrin repeat protein
MSESRMKNAKKLNVSEVTVAESEVMRLDVPEQNIIDWRLLAGHTVDINRGNTDRLTPLQLSLTDIEQLLVERGTDVTSHDNQQVSALHEAAIKGDADLEPGVDPLARDIAGKSPFSLAITEILQQEIIDPAQPPQPPGEAAWREEDPSPPQEDSTEQIPLADSPADSDNGTPPRSQMDKLNGRQKIEFKLLRKAMQEELAEIRAHFD